MSQYFRINSRALATLTLIAACSQNGFAQTSSTPSSPSGSTTPDTVLKQVTVTGNPLGTDGEIAPAQTISGPELLLRGKSTLGETLDGLPGVSSTYFGPNASRPIIRGMDGDRIRILQNGGASVDASGLSFDHAVPIDPLTVERVDVLRGPGALLYGGSAVGGVVNVIDNRIPRDPVQGVNGKADTSYSSGSKERNASGLIETGNGQFALHVDGFKRKSDDVNAPIDLTCAKPGSASMAKRICNSAADSDGGAIGGTLFFDRGYIGASASTYRSTYGTVAEDDVTIGMKSNRYALEGELRDIGPFFSSIKAQFGHSDYKHTEYEGVSPGTVFTNKGNDLRIEAKQRQFGNFSGMVGLQAESTRFSADGEEAFAPFSKTNQLALFAYEELATSWGKLSFGARKEHVKVESFGNPDPSVTRFTPGSRTFDPFSYSFGSLVNVAPNWQLTSNLSFSQRAPKDYELYANGPHVATGSWETGNSNLGVEKSANLDLGAAWKEGHNKFAASAFMSRFKNYISLENTGNTRGQEDGAINPADLNGDGIDDNDPGNPILGDYIYRPVKARFRGVEANGSVRLLQSTSTLDLEMRGSVVRADNLTSGEPLARIAPARAGATLVWGQEGWGARLGFDTSARQTRVPTGENETAGYTMWNAAVTYWMKASMANLLWYARLDNIGDKLGYSASSILTQTVPGRSPLPGRSLKVGLQASF